MTMHSVLDINGLSLHYQTENGPVSALKDIDLQIESGSVVGLVGESGSGKSTLVRALAGILDRNGAIVGGSVLFRGQEALTARGDEAMRELRGRDIGVILQNAQASLNPVRRTGIQIEEQLRRDPTLLRKAWSQRIEETLLQMGFDDIPRLLELYPHQLSGGMAQRVAIAIAVSCHPALLIADECTTALDVTVQAEVVRLLKRLVSEKGTSILFVTHDVALAAELCDKIVVLYSGEIVEVNDADELMRSPQHPYTRALMAAAPGWGSKRRLQPIPGLPPVVKPEFVGCRFASRCEFARDECLLPIPWGTHGSGGYRCVLGEGHFHGDEPGEQIA